MSEVFDFQVILLSCIFLAVPLAFTLGCSFHVYFTVPPSGKTCYLLTRNTCSLEHSFFPVGFVFLAKVKKMRKEIQSILPSQSVTELDGFKRNM